VDLFAALDYAGLENRTSVVLFAVLHHLGDAGRAALLGELLPAGLGPPDELWPQHGVSVGVLDGWIRWPGRAVVVLEAKVDDPLGREQPERYAAWLAGHPEPERVLWLVTRERPEVEALVPTLAIPAGVRVLATTWTRIADRAQAVAVHASEADRLLLLALARRLRSSRVAASPAPALDPALLGLALGGVPQIRALRRHLGAWFGGMDWLPQGWTWQERNEAWCELSVSVERPVRLLGGDGDNGGPWVSWRAQVWAPAREPGRWPADQASGVALRVGVVLKGTSAADAALGPLRVALGATRDAPVPEQAVGRPVTWDSGSYHETWWIVPFDPTDFGASTGRLRAALAAQATRLGVLAVGGEEGLRVG